MKLESLIAYYYRVRKYKMPTAQQALMWLITELGEASELLLARETGWVRNNPQNHEAWSAERFADELGDIVMMAVVAGQAEGVDVIARLEERLHDRIQRG